MRKIISLIMAMCLFLSLAACTPNDTPTESPTHTPTEAPSGPVLEPTESNSGTKAWYQIYVKGFYDSDGDGIGDLGGVVQKLIYISELGYDGVILMPISPSDEYHGKDATDLCAIDSTVGSENSLRALVSAANDIGITVIVDLGLSSTFRSYPDFESANESIKSILNYWLCECGVDGFRLTDMASYYFEDEKNIEAITQLVTEIRNISTDAYVLGDLAISDDKAISAYYATGIDSIQIFTNADATGSLASSLKIHNGGVLGELFKTMDEVYGDNIITTYISSDSTSNRTASYMSGLENIKMITALQMICSGSVITYYGDEIGMVSPNAGANESAKYSSMKWTDSTDSDGYCFNSPAQESGASYIYSSQQKQAQDDTSIYSFYKDLLYLRSCLPSICAGKTQYIELENNRAICLMTKTYGDETVTVVVNLASPTSESDENAGVREVSLSGEELDFDGVVAVLNAYDSGFGCEYNADTGVLTIPPYSIVVLK